MTAVPVVVTSTTADYFVLYVSHDADGTTVEYPVQVTLGADGTTTLAENVGALPAERYRVEKYSVADPADVDGDCIDDLTELADLASMNPVNPASLEFTYGTEAIPDHETFEALAYAATSGVLLLKFSISDVESDRPSVYFQNTNRFTHHPDFLDAVGVDPRGTLTGRIVYNPELIAPDGSDGVYYFAYRNHQDTLSVLERVYTLLAANMPMLEDNLALWIRNHTLRSIQADLPWYRASRMNLVFDEDVYSDTDFVALNPGEGFGLLRMLEPDERPRSRDVVIYETLPNELPRVAGIISTVPQTPLSHVNLRALQDGVPNAFIADALDDDAVGGLIGSHVYYAVTESGYSVRAASQAEVDEHFASSRPTKAQTPQRDLSVTEITALSEIGFDDWDAFGVKAANVAVLGTLGFGEGAVPDGFAVPFYSYDEFMKHNDLYDDVEEMLADPDFQTDFDVKEDELKALRKKIKKGETPEWIDAALTEMHDAFPEGTSLRYRSSTNNEDLPGFNGAGLYDSNTQHPEETEEDGIAKSLKQAYASLWNYRAFIERDFHRVDHLKAAMGVLVHPNYSDELVNGVAVSADPAYGTEGSYYVNSQVGEDLVTNPEAHSVPEEILSYPDGTYSVAAVSNQIPSGQLLMTDDQLAQLRRHLAAIHGRFAELYAVDEGEPFAIEVEFKITSDNVLAIKQARPWIFADPSPAIEDTRPGTTDVALTGRFDVAPATHSGTTLSVRVRFSDGLTIGWIEFTQHGVKVTGGRVERIERVEHKDYLWEIEVTPDSPLENVTLALAYNRPCTVLGALCTFNGRRLSTRLEHTVRALRPPVPDRPTGVAPSGGGEEEPQDEAEAVNPEQLAAEASERFSDVGSDAYYAAAVGWMLRHGITAGCSQDAFCPNQPVTRQQFVAFLWRAAGRPEPRRAGSEIFGDTSAQAYANPAIGWASEVGVTAGCESATEDAPAMFCPTAEASRAQVSAFLYRYMDASHDPATAFDDVDTASYFAEAMNWMSAHGITVGCSPDMFCPHATATRAHVATFLYRIAAEPRSWGADAHLREDLAP